jgi:CheY-like chemotaxis protein
LEIDRCFNFAKSERQVAWPSLLPYMSHEKAHRFGVVESLPAAGFIAAITSLQSWRARRTTNRRILRDLFANAGYELIEAESGEDALSALATSRPDLILMDIQLP